jgi:hypothetical protein
VSAREFAEWMAYDSIEPIGPERTDLNCALIAWRMSNAFGSKVDLAECLPKWDPLGNVRQRSAEEIEAAMTAYAVRHNRGERRKRQARQKAASKGLSPGSQKRAGDSAPSHGK